MFDVAMSCLLSPHFHFFHAIRLCAIYGGFIASHAGVVVPTQNLHCTFTCELNMIGYIHCCDTVRGGPFGSADISLRDTEFYTEMPYHGAEDPRYLWIRQGG